MTSVTTALSRYLPSGDFTRAMEDLIEKENPDNTVGWPNNSMYVESIFCKPQFETGLLSHSTFFSNPR